MAIVRGIPKDSCSRLAQALFEGGIRVIEVTLNTNSATDMIQELLQSYDSSMWIGAGTVIDAEGAKAALSAGAKFFVTPNLDEHVIEFGEKHNIPVFSGALTPSEIVRAFNAGAAMVKVFPSGVFGPRYYKELQGPLSHIPLMAVGGITTANISDFLKAGAKVAGVGGSLIDKQAIAANDFGKIRESAAQLVQAAKAESFR